VTSLTKAEEELAKELISPVLLKLLKPFSASDMTRAIKDDINLGKGLEENPDYLAQLKQLIFGVPFVDKIIQKCKQKKWIVWFINNEMQHKRKDLWLQIIYHPKGTPYIIKQVRKIIRLIFS